MSAIAFQEWLNSSQDYDKGVALYVQHRDAKKALVRLLKAGGPGPFTTFKLVEEITRLVHVTTVSPPCQHGVTNLTAGKGNENVAEQPAEVAALVAERKALFKEAMHLRGQLIPEVPKDKRFEAAKKIKQHFRRIDTIWSDLQYVEKYGHLPPVVQVPDEQDAAALRKRLTTCRTYISQKRGTDEKQAAWAAEIVNLERLLGL